MTWKADPDTSAIFATMAINGGIGLVVLLIFEKVRYNFEVYAPRLRTMKNAVPSAPKSGFLVWVPQVLNVSDDEVLRIVGLDGYVFLRYLRMVVKVGLICSFFGLFVLLPVYGTGAGNKGVDGINRYTMSNIVTTGSRLWASWVFTYLFTFVLLYFLYKEYEHFAIKRQEFLLRGDEALPKQTPYTALVENIPAELQNSEKLKAFLQPIFGGQVLAVSVIVNIALLDEAVAQRKAIRARLENAIAAYEGHPEKVRPMLGVKEGKPALCGKDQEVDAIDYWQAELIKANHEVVRLQLEARRVDSSDPLIRPKKKATNENGGAVPGSEEEATAIEDGKDQDLSQQKGIEMISTNNVEDSYRNDKKTLPVPHIYGDMVTCSALVTFATKQAQLIAVQTPIIAQKFPLMRCRAATSPRDLIWSNMNTTTQYTTRAAYWTSWIYNVGLAFWGVILAFIAAVSSLSNLATFLPFIKSLDPVSYAVLAGMLPVVVLIVFISLLPTFMTLISTYIEKRKMVSVVESEVFNWFFKYQLANVFLILLAGSIFNSLAEAIKDPASIIILIGKALPPVSVFFINFTLTAALSGAPMMLLRIAPLIIYKLYRSCFNPNTLTRRTLLEGPLAPATVNYGTTLPPVLYIYCLMVLYWVIAPILLAVGTIYFAGMYLAWKYQYLYVFHRNYEAGGVFFYGLYNRSMIGLMFSAVTIVVFMAIKGGAAQAPLLIPLIFIILGVWRYTENKFYSQSMNLPLTCAVEMDQARLGKAEDEDGVVSTFTESFLKQPSLTSPAQIYCYPYRIAGIPLLTDRAAVEAVYHEDIPEGEDTAHLYTAPAAAKEIEVASV